MSRLSILIWLLPVGTLLAGCGKADDPTIPQQAPAAADATPAPADAPKPLILTGKEGPDTMVGGDAADHLTGGPGADVLDGAAAYDYARYDTSTAGVKASLKNSSINAGDAAGDVYKSIEALVGSPFDDFLEGDYGINDMHGLAGSDMILGQEGADGIAGEEGDDVIDSGPGADNLDGGPGDDTYVFRAGESDGETIIQFDGAGAAKGDSIIFVGYGAGATIAKVSATKRQVKSADGLITETFEVKAGGDALNANDYRFANSYTPVVPPEAPPATTPAPAPAKPN